MSIPFDGFIGPSYRFEDDLYASVERTVNWTLLANESPTEKKWKFAFARSPGNAAFATLPVPALFNAPNRMLIENRGRVFGVNGQRAFQLLEDGLGGATYRDLGVVDDPAPTGSPIAPTANGNGQVFFPSGRFGYVIDKNPLPAMTQVDPVEYLGGVYSTFQDGYIISVKPNSNVFQISGNADTPTGDATLWDSNNVAALTGQADLLRACISRREYLRLLGQKRSEIFQNVGNNGIGGFPFQNFNSTFIETGIAAPFSLADLGDAFMWIGEDERGQRACWMDRAFSPQRVSNFAVEQFWASYSRIDDAIAFPYIWRGHLTYRVTFPHAYESGTRFPLGAPSGDLTSATWEYDATVSELIGRPVWNERSYLTAEGFIQGRSELTHCWGFGRHLVGSGGVDGNPGAVYQMSDSAYTDCGVDMLGAQTQRPIVRDRICPHIFERNVRIFYDRIQFDLTRGVGLDGFEEGSMEPGADPQIYLRWSNDAGNNFGIEYNLSVGKIGRFGQMVYLTRNGYGRDRVYWLRYMDPTNMGLVGASLDIRPGT